MLLDHELSDDQIAELRKRKIGVTLGLGGGGFFSMFSENPIMCLSASSLMPTEEEIRVLQLHQEYRIRKRYNHEYAQKLLDMPIAADEGATTLIFIKGPGWRPNGETGWAFRRSTWTSGPLFLPGYAVQPPPPWSLMELIDRKIEDLIPKGWQEWKSQHSL